jgi:hypothetical protein
MGRCARQKWPQRFRVARFEQLEWRHLLAAGGLNGSVSQVPLSIVSDFAPAALAEPAAPSNLAITTDSKAQQMPSVAVDPHDANHVVIAYMDYSLVTTGYAGIGVAVSHDGGGTWQYSSVPVPAAFDQGAANPTARFDDQGHLFVSFMAATFLGELPPITNPGGGPLRARGFQANNGIFVTRSDDGGSNWQTPVAVASHIYDGSNPVPFEIIPDLAIDSFPMLPTGQPNPNYGNMYAVWSRYYPAGQYPGETDSIGGSNIMFAVSRNEGLSWQLQLESHPSESADPVTVIFNQGLFSGRETPEGVGFDNWSHVAVGPEGDVYVSQFIGGTFVVHHSANGGKSFDHPDATTRALYPFRVNVPTGPSPFLTANHFRLQPVRAIAADPMRPGTVYVAETNAATDLQGNTRDEGDVVFARSSDYGAHWQRSFGVGATGNGNVINDENDGRSATGGPDDVAAPQVLPRLVTDSAGDVALVWYDTRRDPSNHLLDVFAAVSTDHGQTFSRNFRLTDVSFDADAGQFVAGNGSTQFYLGDTIGLALAQNEMYAAWTDTRNGNQDIFFSRVDLNPIPAPPNDRFEANESANAATNLGRVVERDLPKLAIRSTDEDWFKLQTGATGSLSVTAKLAAPGDSVRLELYDRTGTTRISTGTALLDAGHEIIGEQLGIAASVGQTYLVHVLPGPDVAAETPVRYTLSLKSLTADLGTRAYGVQAGSLADGDDLYYALTAAAAGSLEVTLSPDANAQGNFHLELLDPESLTSLVVAQHSQQALLAGLAVQKGQKVYAHVFGDPAAHGDFSLDFSNLDQFATQRNKTAFIPTGAGPSASVLADVNLDGKQDIIVSHVGQNIVSVILNNGDGTFRAPREFAVGAFEQGGPFTLFGVPNFHREVAVADFNKDGNPDIIAVNTSASDVSVLLGNGDGTFQPQRRFDATGGPFALAVGDINNDGNVDFAVLDSSDTSTAQGAVRLGRGDGFFLQPIFFSLPNREENRTNTIRLADVNGDGRLDLVERDFRNGTSVLLGNGDGTFQLDGAPVQPVSGPGLAIADLDGDGKLDLATTRNNTGAVLYTLGNGDGTFQTESMTADSGQFPIALAAADFGSALTLADGSVVVGPPDGRTDLIVANNGHTLPLVSGPAEIVLLPGAVDDQGHFDGFGDPIRLFAPKAPLDLEMFDQNLNPVDLNGDGALDIVVVDRDGILVIFGTPPVIPTNRTPQTRDLGTVVHFVQPTLTITPSNSDDWYQLRVPSEAFERARDEVLDFSAGFANQEGAGLGMEVIDAAGNVRGSGERLRIVAEQGETLFVHVFGKSSTGGAHATLGSGAYTLVIDTLPQVAAIEAPSLLPGIGNLPGGPTTSLVVVFQGDRMDPTTAQDVSNYTVTCAGPDGRFGTKDDREIKVGEGLPNGMQAAIYDGSSNVNVASGLTYPTAVRQTVTLLFGTPLPAGNYEVQVSPHVTAAAFNDDEENLLSPRDAFDGHPVVVVANGAITEGSQMTRRHLVLPPTALGDFQVYERGTRFLTQFHGDLGAMLDAQLTSAGEQAQISQNLLDQIVARFETALGPAGKRLASLAVLWFDPVSINLADSRGRGLNYDLMTGIETSNLPRTFAEVGRNVEVVVIANPSGAFQLNVAQAAAHSRGGWVVLGEQSNQVRSLTADIRGGVTSFALDFGLPSDRQTVFSLAGVGTAVAFGSIQVPASFSSSPLSASSAQSAVVSAAGSSVATAVTMATEAGGGAAAPSGAPLAEIWENVSGLLHGLSRRVEHGLQAGKPEATDSDLSRGLSSVWQIMSDLFSGALGLGSKPTPSASEGSKPNASQSDAQQADTDGSAGRANGTQNTDHSGGQSAASLSIPQPDGDGRAQSDSDRGQTTTSIEGGKEAAGQTSNVTISFTDDWARQGQQSSANASRDDESQPDATAA